MASNVLSYHIITFQTISIVAVIDRVDIIDTPACS